MNIKMIKIIIIGLILFYSIFIPNYSYAINNIYYVDYDYGSDINDGKSTLSPFKHVPGDKNATNISGGTMLGYGDIILLRGGVIYKGRIDAEWSGSNNGYIIYRSGNIHNTPWGIGRAIVDGSLSSVSYTSGYTGIISLKNQSFIKIEGLEVINQKNIDDVVGEIGWVGNTGGNIIIDNCVLHHGGGSGIVIQGLWDDGIYPKNFVIKNSTIYDHNYHGIIVRAGVDNVLVDNNIGYNSGIQVYSGVYEGDIYFGALGGSSKQTNITLRGNDFYDCPIKSTIILGPTDNVLIENNYLHGTVAVSAIDVAGITNNLTIRNNILNTINTRYEGIIRFSPEAGSNAIINNIKIYNNTLVGPSVGGGSIYFVKSQSTQDQVFRNVDIRNNIIDTTVDDKYVIYVGSNFNGTGPVIQMSTLIIDSNAYNYGLMAYSFYVSGARYNLLTWKNFLISNGSIRQDLNSNPGNILFVDRNLKNFRLSYIDNIAKDKGEVISSFMYDKDNNSRPQGIKWDIGAYEYVYKIPAKPGSVYIN